LYNLHHVYKNTHRKSFLWLWGGLIIFVLTSPLSYVQVYTYLKQISVSLCLRAKYHRQSKLFPVTAFKKQNKNWYAVCIDTYQRQATLEREWIGFLTFLCVSVCVHGRRYHPKAQCSFWKKTIKYTYFIRYFYRNYL
jgi:hypothetical protein